MGDAIFQSCSCWLAAQSTRLYSTSTGTIVHRFTTILAAELRGVLNRNWNSERPLVFVHVVLKNTLGVCRARDIILRIISRIYLWERGLHAGLVGGVEAGGMPGKSETPGEKRSSKNPLAVNSTA